MAWGSARNARWWALESRPEKQPVVSNESHFRAGDVAAPACSPKPPRRAGQGGGVLSLTVQCFDDGRGDIEQGFEEVDHGNLWGVGGIQATAPADTPHAGHEPGLSAENPISVEFSAGNQLANLSAENLHQ